MSEVVDHNPPQTTNFEDWSARFKKSQEPFKQDSHVLDFTFMGPVILNYMSDLHVGHPTTHYDRLDKEVNAIVKNPDAFVFLVGDLIDNMHWNPGQFEEMEQTPEQVGYIHAMINHLADNKKLLASWDGDHDGWLAKSGMDIPTLLHIMGIHSLRGPTYVNAELDNAEYRIMGAHQLPGHSMYNHTHPQMRAERFAGGRGADIIVSGHNHQKGHAEDYTREWPGQPHLVHYLALGSYKPEDSWLNKKGFPPQRPSEMYGSATRLDNKTKGIIYFDDILEANKIRKGRRK